jgi:curved DNA-binding protein CbpA
MSNFFTGVKTLQELKKTYYKLAMINHPDRGGNLETMKEINTEYDKMFDILKDQINYDNFKNAENNDFSNVNYTYKQETSDIFKDIISKIIGLDGIEIEICGYWLWISGNTRPHSKHIKESGFKWSPNKFMWYWRPAEHKSFNRKSFSIDDIRSKYGSQKIKNELKPQLSYH